MPWDDENKGGITMKKLLTGFIALVLTISLTGCYRAPEKFQDDWHGVLNTFGTSGNGDFMFSADWNYYNINSDNELKISTLRSDMLYPDVDGFITYEYDSDSRNYNIVKKDSDNEIVNDYLALNVHLEAMSETHLSEVTNPLSTAYYTKRPIILNVNEDGSILIRLEYDWNYYDEGKLVKTETKYCYVLFNQVSNEVLWTTNYLMVSELDSGFTRGEDKYIYEDDSFIYIQQYILDDNEYVYRRRKDISSYESFKINKSTGELMNVGTLDLEGEFLRSHGPDKNLYVERGWESTQIEVRTYASDFTTFTKKIFEVDSDAMEVDFLEFGVNNLLIESYYGMTKLTVYDSEYNEENVNSFDMTCNYYEVMGNDSLLCIDIYNPTDTLDVYGNVYVYEYSSNSLTFVTDKLRLGQLGSGCIAFGCFSWPT